MFDYSALYRAIRATPLSELAESLPPRVSQQLDSVCHGDLKRWRRCLDRLPGLRRMDVRLDTDWVSVGNRETADDGERRLMTELLQELHPWRKGPFSLHGLRLDAEWRSDRKWARLAPVIAPLDGRRVLDVGCGNGYYGWRMVGAGAGLVIGVDPSLRFVCQYQALRHFLGDHPVYVLPLALEDLPGPVPGFDTVVSMGVLYHRRSPLDHLLQLKQWLRPGGELVLETLVIDGGEGRVLVPRDRYARMRNVWFIPSPDTLVAWLLRCGYSRPRVVDITATTTEEQRATEWMRFQSLADFVDPTQPGRTVEGLPAPVRAILLAEA